MRRALGYPLLGALLAASPALAQSPADGTVRSGLLAKATFWQARGRDDLALDALDKLLLVAPEHQEGLARRAMLLLRLQRPKEAAGTIQRLRALNPQHPGLARYATMLRLLGSAAGQLKQARSLARAGQIQQALAVLRSLQPDGPPSGALALEYWRLAARTPNGRQAALAGLRQLVGSEPDNPRYRLALIELETARPPIPPETLATLKRIAAMPRYEREARDIWRDAVLRLEPTAASLPLLDDYLRSEATEDTAVRERRAAIVAAVARHRKLLKDPSYRARIDGLALLDAGQVEAAEAQLELAQQGRPDDPEVIGGLGLVYLRQGAHALAQAYFDRAGKLDPAGARRWQGLQRTARFWGLMREARDAADGGESELAGSLLGQARKLDPASTAPVLAQARILEQQGAAAAAEKLFLTVLRKRPRDEDAWREAVLFLARAGRDQHADTLAARAPAKLRVTLLAQLAELRASLLQAEGNALLAAGHGAEAVERFERAAALDDADPWLRFKLARQYAEQGHPERGDALFRQLIERHGDDPAARYAYALFQGGQDRTEEALGTLEAIPAERRSVEMALQQRRLWAEATVRRARRLAQAGARATARAQLERAAHEAGADADLITDFGQALTAIDAPAAARTLLTAADALPQTPDTALRRAAALDDAGAGDAASVLLQRIGPAGLTAVQRAAWEDTTDTLLLRHAEEMRAQGSVEPALLLVGARLVTRPDQVGLLALQAKLQAALGRDEAALTTLRKLRAAQPAERGVTVRIAAILATSGRHAEARAELAPLLARGLADDPDLAADAAEVLLDADAPDAARALVENALQAGRENARLHDTAGRIAADAGQLDTALIHYRRANALLPPAPPGDAYRYRRLAEVLERRAPAVAAAVDRQQRSGTPGVSQLSLTEGVIEYKLPQTGPERVTLRADLVDIDAGVLDPRDRRARDLGTVLLCYPNCAAGPQAQHARGIGLHAVWERGPWSADVGTTPLGFATRNLVGGVRYRGDAGAFSYAVEAARRPVTSSLLSYAGMRDPNSGTLWGGVTASGVRLSTSRDDGGSLGMWSNLGWHVLGGTGVRANRRVQWMGGLIGRLVNEDDRLLSLGLTAMAWRFSDNAGEYSLGHGGYYSPGSYRSLSLPLTFAQRFARFSYSVRAALSASRTGARAADYFPADAAAQRQADALATDTGFDPHYRGGASRGTGRSLAATAEYQAGPSLFVGARLDLDRSVDYTPNRFTLYLRFTPRGPAARPVPLAPEPVQPSSRY